ncbi:MAG: MFS transporter, partial [Spirochaetales bacterium]
VGVLSTVILAGDLLTRGVPWRAILGFLSVTSLIFGIVLYIMRKHEPPQQKISVKQVTQQYIDCLKSKRLWIFCAMMIFAGGAEGAFTFWSASYIQMNFATNARMAGFGTACFAAGMMTMRFLSGILVGQQKLRRLIISSALIGCGVALCIPFVQSITTFFIVLFFAGVSIACFWPSIQSYAVDRIPHIDATTAFIIMSCAGVPGFGGTTLIMGFVADSVGFANSFFVVPILLILLVISAVIERHMETSKNSGEKT